MDVARLTGGQKGKSTMTGLTDDGLVKDLERLIDRQEDLQGHLKKLARTYPALEHDERFNRIRENTTASLTDLRALAQGYQELNRAAEERARPVDYTEALCKMVMDTNLQGTCRHPVDFWINVINVPPDQRQYEHNGEKDWLCGVCGLLVPPFFNGAFREFWVKRHNDTSLEFPSCG